MKAERDDTPVLITEAAPSYEEEYAARKRKYLTMMLMRVPCLVLAGIFHDTWWLALGFVAAVGARCRGSPCSSRTTGRRSRPRRSTATSARPTAIESTDHQVIDG